MRTLEDRTEQVILEDAGVLALIEDSLKFIREATEPPRKSIYGRELVRFELENAYYLVSSTEHLKEVELPNTRGVLDYYKTKLEKNLPSKR